MTDDRTVTTYEGRVLPHPHEELVDQGLGFDLGTLLSRRRMLGFLGIGAATVGLAACGTSTSTSAAVSSTAAGTATTSTGEIPEETAGPYPGDGSNGVNVLTESGIVRSDITTSFAGSAGTAEGVPMSLTLTVSDLVGGIPFEGAAVYLWHCTREGGYSMYSEGITDQNYLRGVQVADADGKVTFTSIWPACYDGRWPHIHLEVYPDETSITDAANVIATSQIAMPQDVCEIVYAEEGYAASVANLAAVSLDTDGIFADGYELETPTVSGSVSAGYTVTMAVGVDTTTEAGGGSMPGGGPGGGMGGPGGGAPPSGGPTG